MSCAELHVNYHIKSTLSCTELHPRPLNPPSFFCRPVAPLPEPLTFSRIGRFLHLLARIAEAIRVLSGIRRTSSEVAGRARRWLQYIKEPMHRSESEASPPSAGPSHAADLSPLPRLLVTWRPLGCTLGARWLDFGSLWSSYELTLQQKVDKHWPIEKYLEKVLP